MQYISNRMKKQIYLLLGSNLDDRERNLILAIKKINERSGSVRAVSSLYKTQPWGKSDQPEFLNQAIEIQSDLAPDQLLASLNNIEKEIGKNAVERWGPRVIDIDILFFGDTVMSHDQLTIPHPRIADRRFALAPLCEIAPRFVHPVLHKNCQELLKACTDPLDVSLYIPSSS